MTPMRADRELVTRSWAMKDLLYSTGIATELTVVLAHVGVQEGNLLLRVWP